jgi:hypothetical protein
LEVKATEFECGHETLLHLLLVGLAVSTYFRYPDDVVWALVRDHSDSASWERAVFGAGALMLLGSAVLDTWANAGLTLGIQRYVGPRRLARVLSVLAVGQLLPLPGLMILFAGEAMLILRLFLRDREGAARPQLPSSSMGRSWGPAFRTAASKWGLALSMMVFALTLRDRIAEIGAAASVMVWFVLNFPRRRLATLR